MISRTTTLHPAGGGVLAARSRSRIGSLMAAIGCALMLLPLTANAGTELIRWSHPDPSDVTGFQIIQRGASGGFGTPLDIGLPSPTNNVYSYSISVPDTADTYVAVVAYNANGSSPPSNERFIPAVAPPPPPIPDPEPGPDTSLDDDTDLFPPVSSALYSSNFAANTAGWVDTRANNSTSVDGSLFAIYGVGGTNALGTTDTDRNLHSHITISGSPAWSNYEVRGRMLLEDVDGGIGVTTYSDYPNSDKYYRLRRTAGAGNEFHLTVHPYASASLSCTRESTGVSPQADTWYKFRVQTTNLGGATLIEAKVWPASASEPSGWQASCHDTRSEHYTSGTAGVWSMGDGLKAWDDLEVIPIDSGNSSNPVPPLPPLLLDIKAIGN